jgi:hypothetical protein
MGYAISNWGGPKGGDRTETVIAARAEVIGFEVVGIVSRRGLL